MLHMEKLTYLIIRVFYEYLDKMKKKRNVMHIYEETFYKNMLI